MAKDIIIWNMESSIYDPDNKQKELVFNDEVVKNTWNQTIAWIKTFSSSPIVPTPTADMEVATKKYVDDNTWWGWLSWWASITWTSWTWLTTTIDNSASAWTIGQSIVISNTQTNTLTAQEINTWTSAINHSWTRYTVLQTGSVDTSGWIVINSFWSATQAVWLVQWIILWWSFNTNSSFNSRLIRLLNEQNAWSGQNTWIWWNNLSTELNTTTTSTTFGDWAILKLLQSWAWGTTVALLGRDNINSSTNGLVNYTLSNTQSWATVMQKINLGTSSQGHKAHQILLYNASTSARWIEINTSSTWTWIPIELITTWTDRTALKLSTWFTSTTAPTWASTYINVDIWWTMYRILAQAVS